MINLRLEADFTEKDIEKIIEDFINRLVRVIKANLDQIALEMVSDARLKTKSQGGFDDDTGNLRSSIGYVLMLDGEVITEDFELSDKGTDKQTGIETGKKVAGEIASEESEGWAIVLVAGMDYAYFVEAKGYDVITGATSSATAKLNKAMQNIINAFKE